LSSLVTALQSGNSSEIRNGDHCRRLCLNFVASSKSFMAMPRTQLNSQETVLQQDTVTLATQENNLIGVNEATAATDLSQAETDNSAALAAAAKVLPNSLLNYGPQTTELNAASAQAIAFPRQRSMLSSFKP
jgi:flagellar hook-associated protein 3 FlgL